MSMKAAVVGVAFALVVLCIGAGALAADPVAPARSPDGASSQAAEALEDLPSFGAAFVKMMVALAAILICLLIMSRWLMRKRPAGLVGRSGSLIEIIDVKRLESRKSLYLIRVAGRFYLVGSSEGRLDTLAGGPLDQEAIGEALRTASPRKRKTATKDTDSPPFSELLERRGGQKGEFARPAAAAEQSSEVGEA